MRTGALIFPIILCAAMFGCMKIKGPDLPEYASPRAIVDSPSSSSGAIRIDFYLIDAENETASIAVEYSIDSGNAWIPCTLTNSSETSGLSTSWFPGNKHTVYWDSAGDAIGISGEREVVLKISPSDSQNPSGEPGIRAFPLNNTAYNTPPSAMPITPSGAVTENVRIDFSLMDAESDNCSITVWYSADGGGNWTYATIAPFGGGLSGLSASPGGATHFVYWDSRADGIALSAPAAAVRIRISPSDAFHDGNSADTGDFAVDNTRINNPPVLTITGGPENGALLHGKSVSFTWSGADNDGLIAGYWHSLDSASPDIWTTQTSMTFENLWDGAHVFQIAAIDNANEMSTIQARFFTVEFVNQPPSVSVISPFAGQIFNSADITATWNGSDTDGTVAGYHYSMDSTALWEWTTENSATFSALSGGQHTFRIKAVDDAGANSSAVSRQFFIDSGGGTRTWLRRSEAAPMECFIRPIAYDTTRNAAVLFTGIDVWERIGNAWERKVPSPMPSNRWAHAMAYDSARKRIVLFGGMSGSPLSDTWEWDGIAWTRKYPAHYPSGRAEASMVFDSARGKIVLFGGYNFSAKLNDTWEWDGNDWTNINTAAKPNVRQAAGMVYDSQRSLTVLFGGAYYVSTWIYLDDTWEYNGVNWTQRTSTHKPFPREELAMAYDSKRNKTVLFAGYNYDNGKLNDTWEWDGADWTWMKPPYIPAARYLHSMYYDAETEKATIFGGAGEDTYNDLWAWDGNNWGEPGDEGHPRELYLVSMAYNSASKKTFLFGGRAEMCSVFENWEWDGANWALIPSAHTPNCSIENKLAYDAARNEYMLFGGSVAAFANETWIWNGTDWIQKNPATKPPGRGYYGNAYDSNRNKVVMFGGLFVSENYTYLYFNDTWEWDGINWITKSPDNSPSVRHNPAMAYDSNRKVTVLFGGYKTSLMNDTWEWDGTNWTLKNPPVSPPARYKAMMAYDSARKVTVVYGGSVQNGRSNETWEWNGTNWTKQTPINNPTGRESAAVAFETDSGKILMFGGRTKEWLSEDMWTWDGSGWTLLNQKPAPPRREYAAMAFDSARGVTVLYGGDSREYRDDTWEWDGSAWKQRFPAASPIGRYEHAAAYDSDCAVTLMFGGYNPDSSPRNRNDLWAWNGTEWKEITGGTKPAGRTAHAMVYDSARGVTVLFGGQVDDWTETYYNDTWEFDGFAWTQKNPANKPPARCRFGMAYDSGRQATVVFGGYYENSVYVFLNDVWEWDGTNWTEKNPPSKPSPACDLAFVYDSVNGIAILYGGYGQDASNAYVYNDTWAWDGTSWIKHNPASTPIGKYRHSAAFDSIRGRIVLFGGLGGSQETWEY